MIEFVIGGAAIILLILMLKKKPKHKEEESDNEMSALLSRFLLNAKGERFGETIAIDNNGQVIVKKNRDFFSIPNDGIEEKFGELIFSDKVDLEKARKLGEKWHSKSSDVIEYNNEGMPL